MAQEKFKGSRYSRSMLVLSIALYVTCLTQDAFCVKGRCSDWPAWSILIVGPMGFSSSPANLTWFANPFLFASWICVWQGEKAVAFRVALVALMFAASFMLMSTVVTNEGGASFPITGLRAGYWLWLASIATTCVAVFLSSESAEKKVRDKLMRLKCWENRLKSD
jgi:hypothetical protein